MARLILVLVAIGLVIFLVRALRRKPPDQGPDQQLPPPRGDKDRHDDGNGAGNRDRDANRNDWHDREG